jgi:tetratricopeptide (TPR) repeat protein
MGGDEEGRMYACSSLAKIGGGRALEVLLDLLEDPRGISKAGTVADLAEMGDPAAIETLRQLMSSDPSYDVRIEARHAVLDLCRMHGVEVPELEAENEKADIFDPLARAMHPVTIHGDKKVGRNDPCPCGSGKKYKKCCGKAGTKGKVKKGEGPLSLVFRCGECGWEYEAVAGTAFTTGKPGDHDFYFSEEIRCPECKSNSYELTPWALSSLIAELTIIASEAESRKARGQGPASGTPRVQFIRGEVDGGPMSPQEGVAHYERKIERDPENPENHLRLGNCLRFVNEYDRAVQAYERSLDIDPDYAEPLHALGRIYLDRGEFRKARGYLEKARSSLESGAHNLAKNLSWEDVYTAVLIDLERCLDGIMEGEEEKRQLKAERDGLGHCLECGKPTRSHLTDSGEYMCHRCWEKGGCA